MEEELERIHQKESGTEKCEILNPEGKWNRRLIRKLKEMMREKD